MLNQSNLYKTEWLDLVFQNRNKSYGAYALRAASASIMGRALFIAAPLFILLFVGPGLLNRFKDDVPVASVDKIIDVTVLSPPEQVKPIEPKAEQMKSEPITEKIKTVAVPSKIVVVDKPEREIPMPTVDDLKNAVIGSVTQDGKEVTTEVITGNQGSTGNGTTETPVVDNSVHDGTTVDVYPEFEGGMKAWSKYIQKNLRYPAQAMENEIQGKVLISFVVEKDGSISNVTLARGVYGVLDEEAMRVIRKSPKWKPGSQNNMAVRVRYNIPIGFALGN
ncbi:MAG: energy transducer TonB [Pedobacter sp.]|nr:MAG: energy transducer TonB [Pedobacter sp.]